MTRRDRDESLHTRIGRFWFLVVIAALASFCTACRPANAPKAESIAGMAVSTLGLGVKIADDWCLTRAKKFYTEGDESKAIDLAMRCDEQYGIARKALLAAAYAVDGWSDAANHGKALCALTEATSALTYVVQLLKDAGITDVPREVSMALAATAVLGEMVEAKSCPMPAKAVP